MVARDPDSVGAPPACPIGCGKRAESLGRLAAYPLFRCQACGLYFLGTEGIEPEQHYQRQEFEGAFVGLRTANYDTILGELTRLSTAGKRLLDVGCSSGWFLRQASAAGFACHGVEPDRFFFDRARAALPANIPLINGYFDRDLPPDWKDFDVITFHDVFEHLPEPLAMLETCRRRLRPGGLLVLSLPSADGFVFAIGRALRSAGLAGPYERMFQVHYPYPHLFYFDDPSLSVMAERAGFDIVRRQALRSFDVRGAFHRAGMDEATTVVQRLKNLIAGGCLVLFAGLQHLLPADNVLFILQPRAA